MTARTGMSSIITDVRAMVNAGTADYTVGAVAYWTDDQIQAVLDQYREDQREPLRLEEQYTGGSVIYKEFYFSSPWVERLESGTVAWRVETSDAGTVAGTADYAVNYSARNITFNADQAGTAWYLYRRTFDVNRAAAHIWRQKASYYANAYDVSTDNHSLKRSQLVAQARDMVKYYEREAQRQNPGGARFVRVDSNW